MQSVAFNPVVLDSKTYILKVKRDIVVMQGSKQLGYCTLCIDGQGINHGWNSFANQVPFQGAGHALIEEHPKT